MQASLGVAVAATDRFVMYTIEILHVVVISLRLRLSLTSTCQLLLWLVVAPHSILCILEKITVYW